MIVALRPEGSQERHQIATATMGLANPDRPVEADVSLSSGRPGEALDSVTASNYEALTEPRVIHDARHTHGERLRVLLYGFCRIAGNLADSAAACRHNGRTRGHRLQNRQAKALMATRHDNQIR